MGVGLDALRLAELLTDRVSAVELNHFNVDLFLRHLSLNPRTREAVNE